jgi:glucoamylase
MSFFIPTAAAGNGVCLATFGRSGEIMGFFYPHIDFAQNVREGMPALRILTGPDRSAFLWCFHECWRISQSFERASNVLITRLAHRDLELTVELADCLPPGEHVLLRRVAINKAASVPPVQFMHYFRLGVEDTSLRNAVHSQPERQAIVQHFRDISLAVSASEPFAGECGSLKPTGESTVKSAMANGQLGRVGGAIGRVDFALAFEPVVGSRWQATIALAGAASMDEAVARAREWSQSSFEIAVAKADARAGEAIAHAGACTVPELTQGYERAVICLYDLYDEDKGTFIAAPECDPGYELSGGYGYCWPRDAAVCALAFQQSGREAEARKFFDWAARVQLPDGHWYQRYWTDGTPAPSWCVKTNEIQLDQTCAMVHAAGLLARRLGPSGQSFIDAFKPAAERATAAILAHMGPDGLHRCATDLWECCAGSFPYTQAGIVAALREADEVFGIDRERTGPAARAQLRDRMIAVFWDPQRRRWLRRLTPDGTPDATLDSSILGLIYPWEVLDLNDPTDRKLAMETMDGVSRDLRCPTKGGPAVLRFQNESYMGGGPGCVNTLWLALCRLMASQTSTDNTERQELRSLAMADLKIALANTNPTGQLPELIPRIKFEYWAAPHAWASSLLIKAVQVMRDMDGQPEGSTVARATPRRKAPAR